MVNVPHFVHTHPKTFKRVLVVLVCVLIPLDIFFLYSMQFMGKIYPNVSILDVNLGGKTRNQAITALTESLSRQPEDITFVAKSKTYRVKRTHFDYQPQVQSSVQKAMNIGRSRGFFQNSRDRLVLLRHPFTLPLDFTYNPDLTEVFLASVAAELNEPVIPPSVSIIVNQLGKKEASVSAGMAGRSMDMETARAVVEKSLTSLSREPVELPFKAQAETPTEKQIADIKTLANGLITKNLVIRHEDTEWFVTDEEMINLLSVMKFFDEEKIASWTAELANNINREPVNALFSFEGERVVEFKPAKPGYTLDEPQMTARIMQSMRDLSESSASSLTLTLPVTKKDPDITNDKVNNLGIRELLGVGESWFSHSIPSRIHNVTLASSKMHGVLVPPGEVFSLLASVGEIDAAHGFQAAYIIQNGRTILGDGGGVCQTSTTMFRAALNAGLEIVERHPHAYRVSYYEENYDVGIDASVFSPTADFRFKNDTPAHILIQTYVDPVNMYARYELYGTSDGRKVTISKSRIWDQAPPPPDLYQDDPTLPVGVVKQVDWKAWGAKTAFDWKVERNGQVLYEKTFYSTYRPWQAIFLRGTKEG